MPRSLLDLVKKPTGRGIELEQRSAIEDLDDNQYEAFQRWASHPWFYVTGHWEGKPIWVTQDEKDDFEPYKAFPGDDYGYIKLYLHALWLLGRSRRGEISEEVAILWEQLMGYRPRKRDPLVLVTDKTRQMLITIATLAFADWLCSFHFQRLVVLSKSTEPEAQQMIEDKVRVPRSLDPNINPIGGFPEWFDTICPISYEPKSHVRYGLTGSRIWGVDQNFYEGKGRGITASLTIVDEAAFQKKLRKIFQAIRPQEGRMIIMSTAEQGNDGAALMYSLLERDE